MEQTAGKQSISFTEPVHIISSASVVGPKEGEGPLGDGFDLIAPEADFGEETWEQAESTMQQEALQLAIGKAGLKSRDIRYLFGGDLLAQLTATSFGSEETQIPLFGLYSACSTCGEALALAALTVSAGCAEHVAAVTSSHFGSAEKEFRLPLGYGSQRPLSATWTVTGSGAFVLGKRGGHVRISGVTPGKIVDMGSRDNMNMEHLVLDLSCRKRGEDYFIVTDRWQKFTDVKLTREVLKELSGSCDEFLIHAADVEGKSQGIEQEVVRLLGDFAGCPVTYAGGVGSYEDVEQLRTLGRGHVDVTVGSALDLFGGPLSYKKILELCEK